MRYARVDGEGEALNLRKKREKASVDKLLVLDCAVPCRAVPCRAERHGVTRRREGGEAFAAAAAGDGDGDGDAKVRRLGVPSRDGF